MGWQEVGRLTTTKQSDYYVRMNDAATAFRAIRTRLAMSQAEMGAALGVTQSNVSMYERGQTVLPEVAGRLIEIARARGLEISYDHIYAGADLPIAEAKAA